MTPRAGWNPDDDTDLRRLRRRCARLVRDIAVPVPFDAERLCQEVGDRIGHPITLMPTAMPADGPSGLVITGARAHYLCYDSGTRPLHQQHIIAHELGHLIAGHTSEPVADADLAAGALLSTLDPEMVRRALARDAGYDSREEREAEIIADLLLRRAHSWAPEQTWHVPLDAADVVARIERSLG
jgi:IrrE N-terminal-like domain